ncbi:hypothetical protein ACE10X_13290 [Bradyrhizobium sp. Pha-3]|uniref:hypothetical protein n=1 Tax=Bradyrhizobium sp. Pha-3 TaxID=208375 RepID=UPI0035D47BB2
MSEQHNGYSTWSEKLAAQARDLIQRSLKILNDNPVPDTFAGRKTHEPFPQEKSKYGINDGKPLILRQGGNTGAGVSGSDD